MEIIEELKIKGYSVNEAILDKKMRNLKQSYKNIKNNTKKNKCRSISNYNVIIEAVEKRRRIVERI